MAESQKNEVNDAPKPTSPPSPAITLKIDAPVEDEAISERDDPMDELKACSPSSSSSSPSAEAKPSTSSSSSSSEPQRSKSLATTATNPFATSSQNKFSLRGGILKPPQLSLNSSSGANTKNNNVTSTSGTSTSQPVAPSATTKHSFVLNPSRLNPFGLKNKGDDVAGSGAGGGSTTGSSSALATSSTISSSGSGLGTSILSEKKPPSVVVQVNGETPKFVPLMQQSENKSTNPGTASSSGTSIISSTTTNSSHHPQSLLSVPPSLVVTAASATSATVPQAVVATQPQLSSTSAPSGGIAVQPTTAATVASSSSTAAASTFVFGQNIQDRVVKAAEDKSSPPEEPKPCSSSVSTSNGTTSSTTTSTTEMLFSSAIKNDQIHNSDGTHKAGNSAGGGGSAPNKETKSLSESAREYEETSRANKRKYEEVEVKTGEEEETNILNITCKLFAFDKSSGWQERGRGTLRLNDLEKESDGHTQSRLVFRTTGSLRVVLNTKIWAEMTVEQASEKSVRFTALDANGEIKVFLAMAGIEDSKQLCAQIKSRVQKEVQKHKKVSSTTSSTTTSMEAASSSEN